MSSYSDKPQLSKHRAAFVRSKAKKASTSAYKKETDARSFHQNANRREIRALVRFDCPVCSTKNTTVVHCDSKRRIATVKCGVCLSIQPTPEDLPYPYETSYVPELEKKADIFFRFLDAYESIAKKAKSLAAPFEGGIEFANSPQEGDEMAPDEELELDDGDHLLDGLQFDVGSAEKVEETEVKEEENEGY